jgi:hypothetical protein
MPRAKESPAAGDRRAPQQLLVTPSVAHVATPGRRQAKAWPSWCLNCADPIDLEAVQAALRAGREYVHTCGRIVYRGRSR